MSRRRPLSVSRFNITDTDGSLYLRRWSLQLLRGWTLKLHVIVRPDRDSCLHDHPWPFWTLILWGGYQERTPQGTRELRPLTLHRRPLEYRHAIVRLRRHVAVSLVLTGPRERPWGFWTTRGWRHWRDFLGRPDRALWCAEEDPKP